MMKRLEYGLIASIALWMFLIALGRWLSLGSNAWDLGIFTQFSWMLSHGYLMDSASLTGWPALADHASFILLPISFVYQFWRSSAFLLTIQVCALVGASFALIQLAKVAGVSQKFSRLILFAYFAQPVLWNTAWFDFHPDSLFPLIVLLFLLQVKIGRYRLAGFLCAALLTIRETSVLVIAGLSLSFWIEGKRRLSVFLASVAMGWTIFLSLFWYPLFFSEGHHNEGSYAHLKQLWPSIHHATFHVDQLAQVFKETSLASAPLFFIGLVIPWLIFLGTKSLPWITGSFVILTPLALSSNANQVSLDYHYGMMIAPFLAAGSIEVASGSDFLKRQLRLTSARRIFLSAAVFNLLIHLNFNPGWLLFWRDPIPFIQYQEYLSNIPVDYRVLASNGLTSHLANRRHVDFVAKSSAVQEFPEKFDMLILNKTDPGFGSSSEQVASLIELAEQSGWTCSEKSVIHLSIQECLDR